MIRGPIWEKRYAIIFCWSWQDKNPSYEKWNAVENSRMGRKTEMLYLSSSLPALLSISSIFRGNKLFSLPAFSLHSRDTLADKLANKLRWHGGPPPGPVCKHTLSGPVGTHTGPRKRTSAHCCSHLLRGTPWAYEILAVALTTHGELRHCLGENGENVPATSSSGGPTMPLTVSKPAAETAALSTEVRLFQECQGRMKRTSSVFSWFIPLVPNLLSLSFFYLYLK